MEYRKVQALIGETSFSVILPKSYVTNLRINKGDFVKVRQDGQSIVIEKA
jgi:antitoxin component of MazEF toxin-antitoxin module